MTLYVEMPKPNKEPSMDEVAWAGSIKGQDVEEVTILQAIKRLADTVSENENLIELLRERVSPVSYHNPQPSPEMKDQTGRDMADTELGAELGVLYARMNENNKRLHNTINALRIK